MSILRSNKVTNLPEIVQVISNTGLVGLLIIIVWGGAKGWWVYGREYKEMKQDRDEWKEAALSGTTIAERAIDTASNVVNAKKPQQRPVRRSSDS